MKLVLLFFCVIIFLLFMIVFSTIKLNVKKFNILNVEQSLGRNKEKEILIYAEFYLFGIIRIARIKVTKRLLERLKIRRDVKKLERDVTNFQFNNVIDVIKKFKIKLESINLSLSFGVDSVILTSYLVAFISTILRSGYNNYKS